MLKKDADILVKIVKVTDIQHCCGQFLFLKSISFINCSLYFMQPRLSELAGIRQSTQIIEFAC